MAIAVGSDAQRFIRTANLPARGAFTMWGWYMLTTDRNAVSGAMALGNGANPSGGEYRSIETSSDGTSFLVWAGSNNTAMFSASTNTWYFLALVSNGDGASSVTARWRVITANTLSSASVTPAGTGSTTYTPGQMVFGGTNYTGDFMTGRIHAIGCADAVLSADELLELSYYHEPQLDGIRSLNVFYPCIADTAANCQVDKSGNGRNASSTPGALADSPGLLWRSTYVPYVLPAISVGGSFNAAWARNANFVMQPGR